MAGMKRQFNKSTGRDYTDEYARYQGTPEQKKKRAVRNNARRRMTRKGKVTKGDGKDVDHKTPLKNGGGNGDDNLRVVSKSKNRGFARTSTNKPR